MYTYPGAPLTSSSTLWTQFMVTPHPGVGGSLMWMTCFHELVPEPDVRVFVASGSPTFPYLSLYLKEIGGLLRFGWLGRS